MRAKMTLDDWPDTIDRPKKLFPLVEGGCCVSMYIAKKLGRDDWDDGEDVPVSLLEACGAPFDLAYKAVDRNDDFDCSVEERIERSFDWLMENLGYEIVEV